ncbi:MAG: alpha-N-arabinofuranosidase [Flavobacterium sp.]|uniref:hypothetical protein n=1 Tax=Flavobacterium sp. TaxID=239 RepID=UPI001220F0CA|nr:hypothetical protein [Flavobacterium sp.]RZJ68669.1 MAG: alpha-N-arabinofuranosidase [Flavobacterium sp.]
MKNFHFILLFFVGVPAFSQLSVKIDASKKGEPIADELYGMFMENLGNDDVGNLVDDCLWSELLDDRKFFYAIDDDEVLVPKNRKQKINQWTPIGKVEMDKTDAYVGNHSPKITTSETAENGISQTGIALLKGKKYVGHIFLKATSAVSVQLRLNVKNAKPETISITPTETYNRYDFSFIASNDIADATLEIVGKGNGNFHIGAVSLMPADNIDGFRSDVIKLLKGLNSKIYRWGGNFISAYDWRDGVGNRDKRAPRYEFAWECLEDNDVGTEEMIRFSELVNVELAMTVNAGFGDATSAANWVEYVNGDISTDMGKLRAANGHPQPYGIKKWCVGNESYGWWQLGHLSLKQYIIKHNMFVEKMLEKDPTLELIGSGASIEEMTVTECAKRTDGNVIPDYLSETDWTGGMLKSGEKIKFISEHFYCSVNERFDLEKGKYVEVSEPLEDWTRRPANRIKSKSIHYKKYRELIPGAEKIPVYLDEWTYYTNWVHPKPTLGVTIGHARGLHELFRHTDLFKMAGFTFATSTLSFTDTAADYNSTGLLFKLYGDQFGKTPIFVSANSPQPDPKWPIGGDQPAENAGGNCYPLDVVAAITEDGKAITVSVINPTEKDQSIVFDFGTLRTGIGKVWKMSGRSINARNIVNQKPEVTVTEYPIKNTNSNRNTQYSIPAATINLYRFELQQI